MINYAYRNLFYQDSIGKQLSITFDGGSLTNTDLVENDFTLEEMLNSEQDLCFGQCNSSRVSFTVGYYENSIVGKELTITTTPTGGTAFQIGKYTVISDKPNDKRTYRKIVAYDKLYDLLKLDVTSWYYTLLPDSKTSCTFKQFRDAFFSYVGVTQETQNLVMDNVTVKRSLEANVITGKTILTKLCEINGVYGKITRDGTFKYITLEEPSTGLYPSDTLYPANDLYPRRSGFKTSYTNTYIKLKYEDYTVRPIDKLQIADSRGEIKVTYGTGNNAYVLKDNFFVFGKSEQALNTIASILSKRIFGRFYIPCQMETIGDPCIETGDAFQFFTTDGKQIDTYVLKRTFKGIQALKDLYEAEGLEYRANDNNTTSSQIVQIKDNLRRVEADYVKTDYLEANYITANQIAANYASFKQLQVVEGKIDSLTAIAITTKNLSAQNISADQIKAGTLSVDRINANSIGADKLYANLTMANKILDQSSNDSTTIRVRDLYFRGYGLYLQPVTISGKKYFMLGIPTK